MKRESKRIYLSPPHMSGEEQKFVEEAFFSNWIAPLGPHVDAFESELAKYLGIRGALAVNSGTSAIHLALRLLEVKPGDTVFCSSLTFVATTNPILYLGAEPVFIDSEPESWNMSPFALEEAFINAKKEGCIPKAVIIVDLYGQSANLKPLLEICNYYGVPVVEDAAESLGATYQGKACGTFGKFGIFSFNGNKIITTSGGGMLVSDDLQGLAKARFWSAQSRDPVTHYQHSEMGYNYRLSNVLAGIGRAQLRVLDKYVNARRRIFLRYLEAFSDHQGLMFMPEAKFGRSTRWLTALTVDPEVCGVTATEIIDGLAKDNIEARHVWKPLHSQPLFKGYKYFTHKNNHSISDKLFSQGLCLPSGSSLTEQEQERIIKVIKYLL